MKSSHWMTAAVFALAASAPATWAAPAGSSPLSWVPATAPVVVHLNGLEAARDHLAAFLKNAVPDRADMLLGQYDSMLKNGFQGRKLRGLAKDGPIFMVVANLDGGPDGFAVVAAVSDYAAFRDNLLSEDEKKDLKTADGVESATFGGMPVYFVDKKEYVVFTPSKDLAASDAKQGAGAEGTAGLDGKMDKKQAARFAASDFGVYVNMEAVNEKFGDHIKAARTQFDDRAGQGGRDRRQGRRRRQIEMARKMFEPMFQAVEDAKTALVTADFRPDGVALHTAVTVRSGTATADALKGFTVASFKDLGKLPAGQLAYCGMHIDPAMIKAMTSLMSGLAANESGKALVEAYEDWAKAGPSGNITSFSYPVSGLSVTKFADPDKALDASVKMLQTMGTGGGFGNVAFKEKPEIKANAEKYSDVSFTSVHMVWDFDKMLSGTGAGPGLPDAMKKQLVEGLKKLIGEEVNAWIGADGKSVIQVTAKDWESAQKMLDQYFKGPRRRRGQDVRRRPQAAARRGHRRRAARRGAGGRRRAGLRRADPQVVGREPAAELPDGGEGQNRLRRLRPDAEARRRRRRFRRHGGGRQADLPGLRLAAAAEAVI